MSLVPSDNYCCCCNKQSSLLRSSSSSGGAQKQLVLFGVATVAVFFGAFLLAPHLNGGAVSAVVVDGKRSGPLAKKNQTHEDDSIDGYNTKTCGISDPDKDKSTFVNAAKEGEFPWLVSFQIKKKDGTYAHFCMGNFISDRWILSAAHCFADPVLAPYLEEEKVRVTAGSANAYSPKNKNFTIKQIFYHKRFDRSSPIGFDVSLIEVKEEAPIRSKSEKKIPFINTVCLPIEGKEYKAGEVVKLAGWGDTESKDPKSKPDVLLQTDLLLVDAKECADIFSQKLAKVKNQYHDFKDFICADYHGERDACQGDSGSALLEYADGKGVAIGIVSYGLGCATKGVPGVYTRTSTFMPWIKEITQNKENATVEHIRIIPGKSNVRQQQQQQTPQPQQDQSRHSQ